MSDIQTLEAKAAALRKELTEIESAITVLRRYSVPTPQSALSALLACRPNSGEGSVGTRNWSDLIEAPPLGSLKDVLVRILKAQPSGLTKQEIRDALIGNGVAFKENTLTWNLTMQKELFKSEGGKWMLK